MDAHAEIKKQIKLLHEKLLKQINASIKEIEINTQKHEKVVSRAIKNSDAAAARYAELTSKGATTPAKKERLVILRSKKGEADIEKRKLKGDLRILKLELKEAKEVHKLAVAAISAYDDAENKLIKKKEAKKSGSKKKAKKKREIPIRMVKVPFIP